jgi:hypothetical protein
MRPLFAHAEAMTRETFEPPSRRSAVRNVPPPQRVTSETTGGRRAPQAPLSDRRPTIPCDLADYAWLHTGPASDVVVLADDDLIWDSLATEERTPAPPALYEPAMLFCAGSVDELTTDLLIDLWRRDVPRLPDDEDVAIVGIDAIEEHMLALIDGRASVGALVDRSGIDPDDFVDRLCDLSARGIVVLDRSRRLGR